MSAATTNQQKKPRKGRAQLSCTFCRHRKLKCDRKQPCQNCIKRGQQSACYYASAHGGRIEKPQGVDSAAVQSRIQHLEDLVVSLMSSQSENSVVTIQRHASTNSPDAHTSTSKGAAAESRASDRSSLSVSAEGRSPMPTSPGKIQIDGPNVRYVGSEHWAAILDDIAEVKRHLHSEADSQQMSDIRDAVEEGPDLLVGVGKAYTKTDFLEALPPKDDMDRLMSKYFNSADPFVALIHHPTFQLDYERFWTNPAAAPVIWLGLLFAIMAQASFFQLLSAEQDSNRYAILQEDIGTYRHISAQCLIASNYTKPVRWTLETLALYMTTEYTRYTDTPMGLWILLGMLIRLSMRLGYHRDADGFPQISVFQGEMRRRLWAMVVQLDLLSSVQFGLPRAIRQAQTDTRLPGNYLDSDLHESMTALPPSRPDHEYTAMSYHIVKGRLTRTIGKISDEASATFATSYEHILELDNELTAEFNAMPPKLLPKSIVGSITDPPGLIMKRLHIDLLYHKGVCILHRRYSSLAKTNERYLYSRTRSIASAKTILRNQVTMFVETQPGGRVYHDRWLISGLITEDFTLAAMVLCLNLESVWTTDSATPDTAAAAKERNEICELIEGSYNVWKIWRTQPGLASFKADKAVQVLGVMLRKIKSGMDTESTQGASTQVTTAPAPAISTPANPHSTASTTTSMSTNPAPTTSIPTSVTTPATRTGTDTFFTDTNFMADIEPFEEIAPIMDWIDAPQDINWDEWDDIFQPSAAVGLSDDVWPADFVGEVEFGGDADLVGGTAGNGYPSVRIS